MGSYKEQKHPSGGRRKECIFTSLDYILFGVYLNLRSTFEVYIHPNHYKLLSAQKKLFKANFL